MIKAYYLMRQDLEMSGPKLGIQIGHGTDIVHLQANSDAHGSLDRMIFTGWLIDDRRKVVLGVKTLEKLNNLLVGLDEAKIPYGVIRDKGYTEFDGVETVTGVVILPIEENDLPKAIKRLRLL